MNKMMILIGAAAMTMNAMAQGLEAASTWEETQNWMTASKEITTNNVDQSYIFDLTADADELYTNDGAMMMITDDADVTQWVDEMEDGIFESGGTYFNISSDVQAMAGMGREPMMMQQFMYIGEDGKTYEAKVFAQSFDQWNNGINSTSYFIASVMKTTSSNYAFNTND
jgi:hypothetical protein